MLQAQMAESNAAAARGVSVVFQVRDLYLCLCVCVWENVSGSAMW
jgi:hypothetical protein